MKVVDFFESCCIYWAVLGAIGGGIGGPFDEIDEDWIDAENKLFCGIEKLLIVGGGGGERPLP